MNLPIHFCDGYFTVNHNKYNDKHFNVTLDMSQFQEFIVDKQYNFNYTSLLVLIFKLCDTKHSSFINTALNNYNPVEMYFNEKIKSKITDINYSFYKPIAIISIDTKEPIPRIECLKSHSSITNFLQIPNFMNLSIDGENYSSIYNSQKNTLNNEHSLMLNTSKLSDEYIMFGINVGNYLWHLVNTTSKMNINNNSFLDKNSLYLSCFGVPISQNVFDYVRNHGNPIELYNPLPHMFRVKNKLYDEIYYNLRDILKEYGFEHEFTEKQKYNIIPSMKHIA